VFPIKDDNPTEIFPIFTIGLIAACVAVWVLVQGAGASEDTLQATVCSLGAIPAEVARGATGEGPFCSYGGLRWGALFTSMFLHGSWMHLIGNMWFLWIFGNNIEDSMGRLRFLAFYLVCGLAAAGTHILVDPSSPNPMVGASGAISGIMGAYLVLYPHARVLTAIVFFFIRVVYVPAWVMLAYWFVLQALSGVSGGFASEGVAVWAHVGGFVAGVALIKLFQRRDLVAAKRAHVHLPRGQIRHGGWW
jgi:membrane associated rhomboid family serine protease